jgi:D-psicose/D-tagatose/L-ribulose 3-epimerase
MPFRHAICNEAFEKWDFAESCRTMKRLGYEGIEIAPFTLAADPLDLNHIRRRDLRDIIVSEGLDFVGLHWLMVSPKTWHVTTPDENLRRASWHYVRNLVDLCADLSPDRPLRGVMVFGSPKQRSSTGGLSPAEATKYFVDGLASIAPHAEARGVKILMEALPIAQTDVLLTLDEAAGYVRQIGSPAIQTMFDTHNAIDEIEPHADLIERHFELIKHIHVNENDGRHPGTGDYDFVSVFRKLRQLKYEGWISMEAFDFSPGAEVLAKESIDYLNQKIREEL